jgi:hypothetical protein
MEKRKRQAMAAGFQQLSRPTQSIINIFLQGTLRLR